MLILTLFLESNPWFSLLNFVYEGYPTIMSLKYVFKFLWLIGGILLNHCSNHRSAHLHGSISLFLAFGPLESTLYFCCVEVYSSRMNESVKGLWLGGTRCLKNLAQKLINCSFLSPQPYDHGCSALTCSNGAAHLRVFEWVALIRFLFGMGHC